MQTTRLSLLERLGDLGDEDAWSQFARLYSPIVFVVGRRAGLSGPDCDDLVQEFLCTAMKELPRFGYDPARGRFRSWIRTVALNLLRQRRRRERGERARLATLQERSADAALHEENELEAQWDVEERSRLAELALARLQAQVTPRDFAVFVLLVVEEVPTEEVARTYALRRNHVAVIKWRLLQRLSAIRAELDEDVQ